MNRSCRILNASQFIRGKRLLQLTKNTKLKLPTRSDVRKFFPQASERLKQRDIEVRHELSNQPNPGSHLNVYRNYYKNELSKPGRAALEEQYDRQVYKRYTILAILMMFYIIYGFLEEVDYGIRWLKQQFADGDVAGQVVKRHGPVLIDQSQRLQKHSYLFFLSFIAVNRANSFFVETEETPPIRGDKVLLSQRPLVYTESGPTILFRNKKHVLIVIAGEGDKILLDGAEVIVPEGYVWVESMRPFNRLTLGFLEMLGLTFESNLWDSSQFSRIFRKGNNTMAGYTQGYVHWYNLCSIKFLDSNIPRISYEMRTSSDFGLCPIQYIKKVKSIHQFSYQDNYDIPEAMKNVLRDVNEDKLSDEPKEKDHYRELQMGYFVPDNIQAFSEIINTPGIEYLGTAENLDHLIGFFGRRVRQIDFYSTTKRLYESCHS